MIAKFNDTSDSKKSLEIEPSGDNVTFRVSDNDHDNPYGSQEVSISLHDITDLVEYLKKFTGA